MIVLTYIKLHQSASYERYSPASGSCYLKNKTKTKTAASLNFDSFDKKFILTGGGYGALLSDVV